MHASAGCGVLRLVLGRCSPCCWRRDDSAAKAFDDCFEAGGGTVTVEKGEYAVKGLRLRSNTTLKLKSGAVLKAGRNCDDYDILASDKI